MNIEQLKNNRVELMGKITKEFTFSHELLGESFCESEISTVRLSGTEDRIQVLISDRVIMIVCQLLRTVSSEAG